MKKARRPKLSRAARADPEPSAESLREMPEVRDFSKARPNPYAARIAREGATINGRGRPRKGTSSGPTKTRSRPRRSAGPSSAPPAGRRFR